MENSVGTPVADVFARENYYAPLPGQTGPNPIRYNSVNNPFDTDSTFNVVDSTGKTTFTAKSAMEPVLVYKAREYRNGKFVSENYYLQQFCLNDDIRPVSYMKIDTLNTTGVQFNNQGTMLVCPNYPIEVNGYVKLPMVALGNGNLKVKVSNKETLADTTSVCVLNGLLTDSVHIKFSWTPPTNAKGLYNVFISAKDSNCLMPYNHYMQVYNWSFYVLDTCLAPMEIVPMQINNQISIYPNPANDRIELVGKDQFHTVSLYNLMSEKVKEQSGLATNRFSLDVSDLTDGFYFIVIDDKFRAKIQINRH